IETNMKSQIVFKILLIILIILLAAPLLGALAMMATGGSMTAQMPSMMNERMMGLATIWIALILLLIVVVIVSIVKSKRETRSASAIARSVKKRGGEGDKAA